MTDAGLLGQWNLTECKLVDPDGGGTPLYPFGKNPLGSLAFFPNRQMIWAMMRADRANFASSDPLSATEKERAAAYVGYFSYCGSYEAEGGKLSVTVSMSLFPNWTGSVQTREYTVKGDSLEVRTNPMTVSGRTKVGVFRFARGTGTAGAQPGERRLA